MHPISAILLVALCLRPTGSDDIFEECNDSEDSHVTRGAFTCCSSSPRGLPLEAGLDFKGNWDECAAEPDHRNEDPVISAWRVYRCIVFKHLKRRPLTQSTFAEIMTEKYPVLIRNQIATKMSQKNVSLELGTSCNARVPYPKVHIFRNLFYDIEKEICESDSSGGRRHSHPHHITNSVCDVCQRREELYHRSGDCCSQVAIPFPFIYLPFRYGNQAKVQTCVNDLVNDVGLPPDTNFASHLKDLCYPSCEYYLSGALKESDLWTGPSLMQSQSEFRSVAKKIIPKYFSPKYKESLEEYLVASFRSAWEETKTFEAKIPLSQRDERNCDKGKLKNLLISCRAHRLMETVITLYLNRLCLDKYPVSQHAPTRPPPPPPPSSGSSDETDSFWDFDIRSGK